MPVAIAVRTESRRRVADGCRLSVRVLTALFVTFAGSALLALVAPTAAAQEAFPRTIDDIVEHLRADPVLIQPAMGMGDTRAAHDLLVDLAADVDGPVYVVLADTPEDLAATDGVSEQAAALLRSELGDGLYFVDFIDGPRYVGAWGPTANVDQRVTAEALQYVVANGPGEYPRASTLLEAVLTVRAAAEPGEPLPVEVVDEYAEQPWAFIPTEHYERADALAGRWVATLGTGIAILVAGSIMTGVVHAVTSRTTRRQGGSGGRDGSRTHAGRGTGRGGAGKTTSRRPEADADIPADIADVARNRWERARRRFENLNARELALPPASAAEEALDAAERVLETRDELDAVGAYVLSLQAERELRRIGKANVPRFRPCFINPMHPEARETVRIAGSTIDAPVCPQCRREQGSFMVVRTRWRRRPYVETNTVWARTGYGALVDNLARHVLENRR
ncbi:hypothetical protein G1H11_15345 [Phytoactinopolyspora alkaliphila]|uniref:Uncharacterized protein n=1 Tax=Phytoactinopolyspora alkaliphila TaxID=1783498 RepID=A0A6N9YNX4_9ACTN|nr:hypothetical protein [Phytoactinopolyspora alkaliphila]NED96684.1 hypothetical protein [Phytoactinopolyspora alkaliphila]